MKQEWFDQLRMEINRRVAYAKNQIDAACCPPPEPYRETAERFEKAAAELIKAAHDLRLMAKNKVTP